VKYIHPQIRPLRTSKPATQAEIRLVPKGDCGIEMVNHLMLIECDCTDRLAVFFLEAMLSDGTRQRVVTSGGHFHSFFNLNDQFFLISSRWFPPLTVSIRSGRRAEGDLVREIVGAPQKDLWTL